MYLKFSGKMKETDHLDELGTDGNIILEGSYRNYVGECDLSDLGQGSVVASCEHYNYPSGTVMCYEFPD
jgi:hypothetical protein